MRSRVLLEMPELTLGDFVCASGDRMWDEVNDIGPNPHVVFPRTHVLIAQDGAEPLLYLMTLLGLVLRGPFAPLHTSVTMAVRSAPPLMGLPLIAAWPVVTGYLWLRIVVPVFPLSLAATSGWLTLWAAATVLAQCSRLQHILDGKRRVAASYAAVLRSLPGAGFPQFSPMRYLSRVLVQLPAGVPADRVQQLLRGRGVRTRLAYRPWSGPAEPQTARAAGLRQSLIELPGGIDLSAAQIGTVCQRLGAVLAGA